MNKQDTISKKDGLKDKIGEALEQVGKKIQDAGADKLGKTIHDAGDRLEKSHTDEKHPDGRDL